MNTEITLYFTDGTHMLSNNWEFTFHGFSLHGRVWQFLEEESVLTCTRKAKRTEAHYIRAKEITKIIEVEQ